MRVLGAMSGECTKPCRVVRLRAIHDTASVAARGDRIRRRVLVTGGAGFIGCNLVARLLDDGSRVTILDDLSRPGSRLNIEWLAGRRGADLLTFVEGDVRDPGLVRPVTAEADVVFHLAGQTGVTTSIEAPQADLEVNVVGTINVLEAARVSVAPPVVVYASSNKVYGDLERELVVEEETRHTLPLLPHGISEAAPLEFGSPYGCSKGAADQYALTYARTYGLPVVVFRQSCIYGPRQMGMEDQGWVAWLMLASALGHEATIYGDGKQVRDLLYVDDLVDAYLLAVDAIDRTSGRAYNIGGGPAFALSIWVEFAAALREVGVEPPVVQFAPPRQGDQRVFVSDTRRAASDFGWVPSTPPTEGLRRLADWLKTAAGALATLVPSR
jgi:CDP-paratose 2-epimerase